MSAGGHIPNDPTTWTDWNAPETRGFVKIDCTTGLETVFDTGWQFGAVLSAIAIWIGLFSGRQSPVTPTDPRVYVVIGILVGATAISFVLRLLTDNFFLVDPSRHAVYLHSKFLFTRRVRLLLERQDIAGTATEARRRRSRYRRWTEQRTVLVGRDGRHVPMSDFRRDGLWDANNLAVSIGHQLDVPAHEAPEESRLIVSRQNGSVSIGYGPFSWMDGQSRVTYIALVLVVAVGAWIFSWLNRQ